MPEFVQERQVDNHGHIRFGMTQQTIMTGRVQDHTIRHEYDDYGNHRLVVIKEKFKEVESVASLWVSYQGFAMVDISGLRFIATSDTWRGMWPECIYVENAEAQFDDFGSLDRGVV